MLQLVRMRAGYVRSVGVVCVLQASMCLPAFAQDPAKIAANAQADLGLATSAQSTGVADDTPPFTIDVGRVAQRTRFVIGLDRAPQFQVFSLTNPNRVIVELPDVGMQLPPANGTAVGLIKSFRGGVSAPGRTRIVIDVMQPVIVESAKLEKGKDAHAHRLVLDIAPVEATAAVGAKPRRAMPAGASALGLLGPPAATKSLTGEPDAAVPAAVESSFLASALALLQPPVPRPAVRPAEREAKTFKPTVVIDPGHGGHDSGAHKNGVMEKDVVLAFSLALRDKLLATGRYNVLMTRDDDTFVPLDDRREFAEKNKAGLFIAVHADEGNSPARGATIYQLRSEVAKDLKRSARGEVATNVLTPDELAAVKQSSRTDVGAVQGILSDLARHEVDVTQERSSVFTRTVTEYMSEATNFHGAPDREAAFRVLKTAQTPSVLIELAFVSNAQDAKLLKSDTWRDKVSQSISTAVENYFANEISRMPM